MRQIIAVIKKELVSYFYSPIAYVFISIFLLATVGTTFFIGNFFNSNQASLEIFFNFHLWLYLFLIPAIGMRLWSEEKNIGTIELLLTLPISIQQAAIGKFVAGWIFVGICLLLTFPMIITVEYLGAPDYGVIIASYLGSFLMAGSYLSVSCLTSGFTRNQVISFILSVMVNFIIVLLGWGVFNDALNVVLSSSFTDIIASFSYTTHFQSIRRGIIDTRDIFYFISFIVGILMLNILYLDSNRGN